MTAKTKTVTVRRGVWEQLYLPEIMRGMGITLKHFFVNTFGRRSKREIVTVRYPEERVRFPDRYRGLHRLMKREDGSVRCTACMMCATVCPANCIHIEADERRDSQSRDVEKFPKVFEIDELVCVVCGLCVEACPCDALRMDSQEPMRPVEFRHEALLQKEELQSRGNKSIAKDGGAGGSWRQGFASLGNVTQIYQPDRNDD